MMVKMSAIPGHRTMALTAIDSGFRRNDGFGVGMTVRGWNDGEGFGVPVKVSVISGCRTVALITIDSGLRRNDGWGIRMTVRGRKDGFGVRNIG